MSSHYDDNVSDKDVWPEHYEKIPEYPSPIVQGMIRTNGSSAQHILGLIDYQEQCLLDGYDVLKPSRFAVAAFILRHLNLKTQTATPSVDTVAQRVGVTRKTAQKILTELVEEGILDRRERPRNTSVYGIGKELVKFTNAIVRADIIQNGRSM